MLVQKTSQIIYEDMIFTSDAICCNTNSWLNFLEYGINNKGNVIVIYSHICPEVLFVMLASLSSEYIYLPIDIEIPLARVNKILSQVNVRVIITEKEYINAFEKYETCDINKKLKVSNERLFKNQLGKGNAYILFTSGSTGVPKGVLVSKYALERFINGTCKAISFSNIKSIICITSISFDIFFMESIFALMMGWKVFLASYIERRSPRIILKMIELYQIDMLQVTPSRLKLIKILDPHFDALKTIKLLMVGGEQLSILLLEELQKNLQCQIYNAYGPTETTIWVSYKDITNAKSVLIGKPIEGVSFYILDSNLSPVNKGEIGELCIAGSTLAEGYICNKEETSKKFLYASNLGRFIYRTGDKCRVEDGNIMWLGRNDYQIKLRGYRIEISEIEKCIEQYELIDLCAVVYFEKNLSNKELLVCCVIPKKGYNIYDINKFIKIELPRYMWPDIVLELNAFPYTVGGKLDRNELKNMVLAMISS